jgi:hypothetical protein
MTKEQIELAGRIRKVVKLAASPGMDPVAIKLNCRLTYNEECEARNWAKAFELAQKGGELFVLAEEYLHEVA